MPHKNVHILSIAPYRILPPKSGGQVSIVSMHQYMGKLCHDHMASTADNSTAENYAFELYPVFPNHPKRYIPFYKFAELSGLAQKYDVNYIICEHPYMFPTAIALSKRLKIPWFIRSHNIESERFRTFGKVWWPVMNLFERLAMKLANGIFFITPEDRDWAITHYGVKHTQCHIIPHGTVQCSVPEHKDEARRKICQNLGIINELPWMYFLGALDYLPNVQAVAYILDEILPRLRESNIHFQVIIAGKGLSEALQNRIQDTAGIVYIGFVEDLNQLLNACDVMLNPVILGGGIKTKAVEALGFNKVVVSTRSGAAGIDPGVCGNNLLISADNDWNAFATNLQKALSIRPNIPRSFYDTYYWGNIAERILNILRRYKS